MALRATYREAAGITVVDISGRITLGEGSALLRKTIRELLDDQRTLILLNLADVDYIDSSGIGELVSAYSGVKNRGGSLKLLQLTKKVHDLLQLTKLFTARQIGSCEESLRISVLQKGSCAVSSRHEPRKSLDQTTVDPLCQPAADELASGRCGAPD